MKSICLFFYQSVEVNFLFKSWHINTIGPYIATLIVSFLFGFLLEIVTFFVQHMKNNLKRPEIVNEKINSSKPIMECDQSDNSFIELTSHSSPQTVDIMGRVYLTCGFFMQLFLAYLIMLIVMTYNMLLFLAPILGMIVGYIAIQFIEPRFPSGMPRSKKTSMRGL